MSLRSRGGGGGARALTSSGGEKWELRSREGLDLPRWSRRRRPRLPWGSHGGRGESEGGAAAT
jgi:hypothetical protein